jgi:hypothetical protein
MTTNKNTALTQSKVQSRFIEKILTNGFDDAIQEGWNLRKVDESGYSVMYFAAMTPSDNLRKLVAAGGDIHIETNNRETLLHVAASHGLYGYNLDTAKYILEEVDASKEISKLEFINKQSYRGETALTESSCSISMRVGRCNTVSKIQDSFKMQSFLLDEGADPSIVSQGNQYRCHESFLDNVVHDHYKSARMSSRLKGQYVPAAMKEYFKSGYDADLKQVLVKAIEKGLNINTKISNDAIAIIQIANDCNIPLFKLFKDLGALSPDINSDTIKGSLDTNCVDKGEVATMKCLIDNYNATDKCGNSTMTVVQPAVTQVDSIKPVEEQSPVAQSGSTESVGEEVQVAGEQPHVEL